MPTNLYGPNDNFDLRLISRSRRRFCGKRTKQRRRGAQELVVWGSGKPRREFLHVDDLAACLPLSSRELRLSPEIINVGWGEDISDPGIGRTDLRNRRIRRRAGLGREQAGRHAAKIARCFQSAQSRLAANALRLREGIARTYEWFLQNCANE